MAKGGDKDFLFEASPACGMIYLTLDHSSPVFIGFHHRIKVEIILDQNKQTHKFQKCGTKSQSDCKNTDRVHDKIFTKHLALPEDRVSENLQINSGDDTIRKESSPPKELPVSSKKDPISLPSEVKNILPTKRKQSKKKNYVSAGVDHDNFDDNKDSGSDKRIKVPQKKINRVRQKAPRKRGMCTRLGRKNSKEKKGRGTKQSTHQEEIKHSSLASPKFPIECNASSLEVEEAEFNIECDSELETENSKYQRQVKNPASGSIIKKDFECEFCFKRFESRQDFFNHRRSKTESHECKKCGKMFSFRAHLLVHMREHKLKQLGGSCKDNVCDICGVDSKTLSRLKKHMLIHTGEFYYKCCVCDRNISGFGAMNNHMVSHKNAGMIKCNCCEQYFASRAELSKHQLALLEIKCNLCGDIFPNRTSRTVHYKLAHPDNILKCQICSHMFSSDKDLSNHMVYHTKYKKKQCTTCGKFVSRLEKHVLTHKSLKDVDESELFICDKCPMKFMLKSSLQRHQRTHSEERPFQCYQCPKSFACRSVLLKHIKTHSSIMPYECEVCGKRCKEKSNLKVHMRIHSDTKAFPCTACTQAFSYKSSLEGHMRSKHSTKKDNSNGKRSLPVNNFSLEDRVSDNEFASVMGHIKDYPTVSLGGKEYTQVSGASSTFSSLLPNDKEYISSEDLSRHNYPHSIDLLPAVADRSVGVDHVHPNGSRFLTERSSFSLDS